VKSTAYLSNITNSDKNSAFTPRVFFSLNDFYQTYNGR